MRSTVGAAGAALSTSLQLATKRLEWQVFRDTENMEKSQKLSTKQKTQKIAEISVFVTQKQENHCF